MSPLLRAGRRELGGREVGPLALGCWRLVGMPVAEARAQVEAALAAGLTLIDTADVYGLDWGGEGFGDAEALLGKVLRDAPALREEMRLATKGGIVPGVPYDSSGRHLVAACEASLQRLGVDHLDLYQIHRPDLLTHPAELADTLVRLRDAGKIRHVGVSNFTPAQTDALAAHLPFPIVSDQFELSLAHLDPLRDGTLDACMRTRRTPLLWSPLAGGAIASGEGVREELLETLDELAEREGVARTSIAYAFLLALPAEPIVIVGTTRPERLAEATAALDVGLDRADFYRLLVAAEGVPLP